ncbi:hypothetical protein [Luteolibacter soli]|uniref:DUF4189 domain-containing protein n=1 Tax=Luteolibacter soli TaxID=3135280 RepID=A0ABU9ARR4_9BACT
MRKRTAIAMAVILASCGAVAVGTRNPPPTVSADFSGWPVEMNGVIRNLAKSTWSKVEIEEEFTKGSAPGVPYGCSLVVHRSSNWSSDTGAAGAEAIRKALEGKGCRVISTDSKSCKADYQLVYAGPSRHGMISLKALGVEKGMQLIICLEEDLPNGTASPAEPE